MSKKKAIKKTRRCPDGEVLTVILTARKVKPGRPRIRPEGGTVTVYLSHRERAALNAKANRAGISASRLMGAILGTASRYDALSIAAILASIE